jgi:hypothetical protein
MLSVKALRDAFLAKRMSTRCHMTFLNGIEANRTAELIIDRFQLDEDFSVSIKNQTKK